MGSDVWDVLPGDVMRYHSKVVLSNLVTIGGHTVFCWGEYKYVLNSFNTRRRHRKTQVQNSLPLNKKQLNLNGYLAKTNIETSILRAEVGWGGGGGILL